MGGKDLSVPYGIRRYSGTIYGAKTTNLDFKANTGDSRVTINTWVEDKTEDRIRDLIPEGAIHTDDPVVITNAICFKGDSVQRFDK